MARFIIPKIKSVHRDYIGQYQNNPVNINMCKELIKRDEDNGYGKSYPIIRFVGCNTTWFYGEKGHKLRNEQYEEILDLFQVIP